MDNPKDYWEDSDERMSNEDMVMLYHDYAFVILPAEGTEDAPELVCVKCLVAPENKGRIQKAIAIPLNTPGDQITCGRCGTVVGGEGDNYFDHCHHYFKLE